MKRLGEFLAAMNDVHELGVRSSTSIYGRDVSKVQEEGIARGPQGGFYRVFAIELAAGDAVREDFEVGTPR